MYVLTAWNLKNQRLTTAVKTEGKNTSDEYLDCIEQAGVIDEPSVTFMEELARMPAHM